RRPHRAAGGVAPGPAGPARRPQLLRLVVRAVHEGDAGPPGGGGALPGPGAVRRRDLQRQPRQRPQGARTGRGDLPGGVRRQEHAGRRLRRAGPADDVLHRAGREPPRTEGRRVLGGPVAHRRRPPLRFRAGRGQPLAHFITGSFWISGSSSPRVTTLSKRAVIFPSAPMRKTHGSLMSWSGVRAIHSLAASLSCWAL